MEKLYFIRHGESQANRDRVFAGTLDSPLTSLGREQALKVASQATKLNIDCIVTSPLSRAKETAMIIADYIQFPKQNIIVSELLIERCYGDLQGKPYETVEGIIFEEVPGIETEPELIKRGQEAAKFLKSLPKTTILVAGHGTSGRVLRQQILQQEPGEIEVPIEQELPNSQIVRWL